MGIKLMKLWRNIPR